MLYISGQTSVNHVLTAFNNLYTIFQGKLGELLLSLSYQPSVGRVTVIVMKAKDLKAKDITGASGI